MKAKWIVLSGLVAAGVFGAVAARHDDGRRVAVGNQPQHVEPAPAPAAGSWNSSPEARAKREKLIGTLQRDGVFGDIRVSHGVGQVVAGPSFYALTFEQRQTFASVAFAWCLDTDPACKLLVLNDRMSGKEIGRFGSVYGGLRME